MRLFAAIDFSEGMKAKLKRVQDELSAEAKSGDFTAKGNLHLTLIFLGECDREEVERAKKAMDRLSFAPFYLEIDRVGHFARPGGDIYWAGVKPEKELMAMQKALAESFAKGGFNLERRRYTPHITLGRRVVTDQDAFEIKAFGEHITNVVLMVSERVEGKLVYRAIHERKGTNTEG